jgi:Biotin-requiring enzyme/e3 binding domain
MAGRIPIRLLSRHLRSQCRRGFSSSPAALEAHNFTMPAMSPTMTEGNISSWKVKEGDSFEAGDILLEIETDKASMDVEAQDDGKMAKIFLPDGSKQVKVGTRIAVLADPNDDLSSLEIPADDSKPAAKAADTVKKVEDEQKTSEPQRQATPEAPRPTKAQSATTPSGPGQNTKYPLYPSVIALIHENHIPDDEVTKIPATGPNNRLLKGDVLAYLGTIEPDYSSKQSQRIAHMAHLDLSNIKIAKPAEKPATAPPVAAALPDLQTTTSVSLPISLTEVLKVQKRIQDAIGVLIPLHTFLARAVDIANDDLPKSKDSKPSSDDLFNAILGFDSISTTSKGTYLPQIDALSFTAPAARSIPKPRLSQKPDIIDILAGRVGQASSSARPHTPIVPASSRSGTAMNIFTLTVPLSEEKRARTFLERMKTVLQVEPGRLVH